MSQLMEMLKRHEGLRLKPYKDSVGKLTIGIGRNLDDVGITNEEATQLLQNDISKALRAAADNFFWFLKLDAVRQDVVISMIFNMGLKKFSEFKKTIEHIANKRYAEASEEMLKSAWAKQVGQRSIELSHMMKTGSY